MPRPLRQDFPGAWHHVMNRGADHRDIFERDVDREVFLDSVASAAERVSLEVHSYCLMSNHFHLLIRSSDGRLADGMQFLSGRFTRLINVRVGRDGPLFRGRYASVLVETDAHLVQAMRYIHLNPVTAGLAARPEIWRWSSAAAYFGEVPRPVWLQTGHIVDLFGPQNAMRTYRGFIEEGIDAATADFYAKVGWP